MDIELKIVKSALELFYYHGFHATGVEQIRAVAGVSKKTLYKYFPSKDELIVAVLNCRHLFFIDKMKAYLEKYPVAARPEAYLQFMLEWGQETTFNGCMFVNAVAEYAQPSSQPFQIARAHKSEVFLLLVNYCRDANLAAAEALAAKLFVLGEGVIVNSKLGVADFSPEAFNVLFNDADSCIATDVRQP